jgi:hypothetical protein
MSRFIIGLAVLGLTGTIFSPSGRADDIYFKETRPFSLEEYKKLLKKEDAPPMPTPKDLEETEKGVRKSVYKLTEHERHLKPGLMAAAYKDCDFLMTPVFAPETNNIPLQQAFTKKMVEELDTISKPKDQHAITRVNAARVLARLAELSGAEETADLAVKIIKSNDQVDGARYWAFRALKLLFTRARKAPEAARREKVVEALVQFIERANKVGKDTPQEELDGICVVRREAIRALAVVRDPGVANKKGGEAAWTLLRVLRRDKGLVPDPRLDEQVEAAIGLSNLRLDGKGDYQPGYAVHQVGQFVLDFLNHYKSRKLNREPFKIHAARMAEALENLATALPGEPTIKAVVPQAVAILRGVEQNKGATSTDGLSNALTTPPAASSIYKSNPKAVADPREG